MKISCIVLASGMSKRMGQNKLTLKLNNKMVFEYTLDLINKISFDEVIVVTRFKEVINYSKKYNFKIANNKNYYLGQSESIKSGVEIAREDNDYMFFVADQPMLTTKTVNKIIESYSGEKKEIVIPFFKEIKGNPIIFNNYYRESLLTLEGDKGGSAIIKNNIENCKKVYFTNDENEDIDSIEDYRRIRGIYER